MTKKLLIVESPAKIKTISKMLGKDFKIMSSVGHIKDLPTSKSGITMTDKSIDLEYVTIKNKDKVIKDIVKEAKSSQEIYIAPDPDREGEIIAWHIQEEVKKVAKPEQIHRVTFNEITKPAVTTALENPRHVDMDKVHAQQARRVLDRWVGYEVSPVLWQKIAKGLSAGRVQSVALRLVCMRQKEIDSFIPEEYWSIHGIFTTKAKEQFIAEFTHKGTKKLELKNQEQTDKAVQEIQAEQFTIKDIIDKKREKNPVAPFITSTLQQAAGNKLGFPVKRTMSVAQEMYEGVTIQDPSTPQALITYMRTDSVRLSDTAIDQARGYIASEYGNTYLPAKAIQYGTKSAAAAQDAHEAIRPIDVSITPDSIAPYVSSDVLKLYTLIWSRFVACQMKPAIYAQRQVVIVGDKYTAKITGSTLLFDGFLKAYQEEDSDENAAEKQEEKTKIPASLEKNDAVGVAKIDPKQHFTQAPPRYTESSLVKEMEKLGIGRPSTYANILTTIQTRLYVTVEKKRFSPTELGMKVTDMLCENLPKIMDVHFTATMEEDLDKIANHELERDKLLREFWASFIGDLEKFKGQVSQKVAEPTEIDCPECGAHKLIIRASRNGTFAGCSGFPECKFTSNFSKDENGVITLIAQEQAMVLDEICPKCKTNHLREMSGKFGKFVACSGYPKCKFIKQNIANFACPNCKSDVVERKGPRGTFWGCSMYPKCKFVIFSQIEQIPCPQCKNPYLLKQIQEGKAVNACPNQECGYTKEQ